MRRILKSKLFTNISLLYILQAANYLVPLVTLPYLARTLGVDHFGVLGIALAVVAFMTMLTDWGFSYSATQEVARNASQPEILRRLFWDTFWARIFLGVLAFIGLAIVMIAVPSVGHLGPVMLAASVQVTASMVSVGWFLQGLERMGSLVTASMLGRALVIPLTFLLVHNPEDVAMATLIPGLCALISAFASFRVASKFVHLGDVRLSPTGIREQLRLGAKIFISTGAVNLYTQTNVLVLGALSGSVQAGFYHGGDRIRRAVQALIGPVSIALFPRINNLLSQDRHAARGLMLRMLIGQGGVTFFMSVAMFVLAPWGVPFILGREFVDTIPVVQWLSLIPFLAGVSNVLGLSVMLPLGMKNEFMIILLCSAVLNLAMMVGLCPHYGATGAAAAAGLTEVFVTSVMGFVVYRRYGHKLDASALRQSERLDTTGSHAPLKIVVGLATAGRREILAAMMHHLAQQTRLPDHVLVCPAQENDIDRDALAHFPIGVEVVQGGRGLCAQRNVILKAIGVDADLVVFFDDDFLADPKFLAETERLFAHKPEIVAATGQVLADGITNAGLSLEYGLKVLSEAAPSEHRIVETYNAYGCNMAIRLAPVRDHQLLFDESLPFYSWLEDVDFCRALAPHGRIVHSSALRGVHLGTKRGRTSGLRFGYSQIANPIYLARKGTLAWWRAVRQMGRNIAANFSRMARPEPWIDRRGRLKGNFLALGDLLRGKLGPTRILDFE